MTSFAVPITTKNQASPVGVVCCYSMIQSGSVPFVLKFVQQALHLLWSGLDNVQPHQSVGKEMWQDVGPADLGEMAADVEMQRHFISKKRPYTSSVDQDPYTAPLSAQLQQAQLNNDSPQEEAKGYAPPTFNFHFQQQLHPSQQVSVQAMQAFQNHIKDAVRQVGEAMPFSHSHIATTVDGSKRAHVTHQVKPKPRPTPAPLAMPSALPTHIVKSVDYRHEYAGITETRHSSPPRPLGQITAQLDDTPANSSYTPPPPSGYASQPQVVPSSSQQPQQPQTFTQHPPGQNMVQAPAPAPSQISQNLLSQGMLQSIASQQYNFSNPAGTTPSQQSNAAPQTYGVPASAPPLQQTPTNFCPPANSGYPAPDAQYSAPSVMAVTSGKGKVCRIQGCDEPSVLRRPYCTKHSGNRLCEHNGCNKCAQGSTRFCIAHGGGRRCTFPGCDKGARDKFFCAAHGGGKRCKADGCNKSAVGGSSLYTADGGGRRCAVDGCDKSAQSSTKYCVKHGGGKKCCHEGCEKVARGRTQYCAAVSFVISLPPAQQSFSHFGFRFSAQSCYFFFSLLFLCSV